MHKQFWLYPILGGVFIIVIAHPSGLGLFPVVAWAAPALVLINLGFIVYIARRHRPKLMGVIASSCFFIFIAYVIVQSTLHY